jgi:hypothetical protein
MEGEGSMSITNEQIEAADRATGGNIPLIELIKSLIAAEEEREGHDAD